MSPRAILELEVALVLPRRATAEKLVAALDLAGPDREKRESVVVPASRRPVSRLPGPPGGDRAQRHGQTNLAVAVPRPAEASPDQRSAERVEEERIGRGTHERLHDMIDGLGSRIELWLAVAR